MTCMSKIFKSNSSKHILLTELLKSISASTVFSRHQSRLYNLDPMLSAYLMFPQSGDLISGLVSIDVVVVLQLPTMC